MKQAFGIDIPHTLEDVCNAKRLALLVYDMQVGIKAQVKEGDAIVLKIRADSRGCARSSYANLLYPAHVLAQGTDGRLPI